MRKALSWLGLAALLALGEILLAKHLPAAGAPL
jgi:hypothetical protein